MALNAVGLPSAVRSGLPSHPKPDFSTAGSDENAGLALVSVNEQNNEEVLDSMTAFAFSPMFKLALTDYRKAMRKLNQNSNDADEQEDFAIRMLCARCFRAGIAAERMEVIGA